MPKIADLSPADRIRWAVDVPGQVLCIAPDQDAKGCVARFRAAVAHSRIVTFDAEAARRVGALSVIGAETLYHLAQSARLPWDSVLVEFNRTGFLRGTRPGADFDDETGGIVLLLEAIGRSSRVRLTSIATPDPAVGGPVIIEPVSTEIDTSFETYPSRDNRIVAMVAECCRRFMQNRLERDASLIDRLGGLTMEDVYARLVHGRRPEDLWLLGSEFVPMLVSGTVEWSAKDVIDRNLLAGLMAPALSPYSRLHFSPGQELDKLLDEVLPEAFGSARIALTILILLGMSGAELLTDPRPRGHHMVGNRRCPYLAKSRLVIDLDHPMHRVAANDDVAPAGDGTPRRRHGVRGFWRHYRAFGRGGRPDCAHQWQTAVPENPETPVDPNRQVCGSCGARRTWIPAHERGDAGLGYVHHDRVEVIA